MRTIEEIEAVVEGYIEKNGCDPNTPEALSLWIQWMEATTRGIKPSRLKELCQAERENRCYVSALKIPSFVHVIVDGHGYRCMVSGYKKTTDGAAYYFSHASSDIVGFGKFYEQDIGKTVFLTREEATNALKGEGHE